MTRFSVRKLHFGARPEADTDDHGEGLPTPARVKLAARRAAGIAEAKAVLDHLPGPGESTHLLFTARMDLTDAVNALLEKLGPCERMAVATLGYNRKNLKAMLAWLDSGAVGSLAMVASIFFRSHNGALWAETLEELRARGQRASCCDCHAKVVALSLASGGRYCLEGSANLCGSGSGIEQLAVINDAGLTEWHRSWIEALVTKHESNQGPG
jgi:hypothetical protein